jgi:hypothetical protein
MRRTTVRLGAGAGFAGDRIDPAVALAEKAELDYLIFECLGERTVALGNVRRLHEPDAGYDPMLTARMRAVLPLLVPSGARVITNAGAANPEAAARKVCEVIGELGFEGTVRVAAVTGDDVLAQVVDADPVVWETGRRLSDHAEELVSANAYLGAEALLPALRAEADVVIGGRLADPSLYLAPLIHEFGWDSCPSGKEDEAGAEELDRLAGGTLVGHLLECAGQLTGGSYADPVTKPVPGMDDLGFPYADVDGDGGALLQKLHDAGGVLTLDTCREQLVYEVADPQGYITPDITADFSGAHFDARGEDRVQVRGAIGRARPDTLKVTLGFHSGWAGEGQISYAGPRAMERAELASQIVTARLVRLHGFSADDLTTEYIGTGSTYRQFSPPNRHTPEVRVRISGTAGSEEQALAVAHEVESLYTNGPAGGGGARGSSWEVVAVRSTDIPREKVTPAISIMEVHPE